MVDEGQVKKKPSKSVSVHALIICVLLAAGGGIAAGTGSAVYLTGNVVEDQHHTDCQNGNENKAAIRDTFHDLGEAFVAASSPSSQPRVQLLADQFDAKIAEKLPDRPC